MSYQVLARKWRPNVFSELVGQEHVVSAISNALDNNRLHHAYLFTGTRGVGKTTIARIFSKSLNCETGMSSKPCGVCATCKEIEQGNYIDLLEIDAASRTKVEDTRELLDNVQYKPTRGDFKVYLIDEVHMLSKHSFNALLKTLEEPPPHVKFLLATTDPQKLPVTILSRCLQFNLKALSRTQIAGQLEHILNQENLPAEKAAIAQLSRAAQGSMRDALSLTDQAIAQGNGQVTNQVVTDMLGLMDKGQILKLVHAVLNKDSDAVFAQVEQLSYQAPDYLQVLAEIMSLLHQVALTQYVPDACKLETVSARAIYQLAKTMPAEQVQLLYQIALQGKKDLPYAADGRSGLEMTLLRMLAFTPSSLNLAPVEFAQLDSVPAEMPDLSVQPEIPKGTAGNPRTSELHAEPEPAVSDQAAQDVDAESVEQTALLTQQEQIIEQAAELHPGMNHVLDEPQPSEGFLAPADYQQNPPTEFHDMPFPQSEYAESAPPQDDFSAGNENNLQAPQERVQPQGKSTTESLLELKLKLQNSETAQPQEEPVSPVKKSEPHNQDSIGQLLSRKNNLEASETTAESVTETETELAQSPALPEVTEPTQDLYSHADVDENVSTNPEQGNEAANQESPPWDDTDTVPEFVGKRAMELEPQPAFDPNAHLEEEIEVEVDFEVPPFLESGQKVVAANQLDTWSQLIEQMNVTALTKQLALHSAYSKQENQVFLTLLDSKQHLDTPTAREQLQNALSESLQQDIELVIRLDKPINTPFAVQQTINQVRQQHAEKIVETDESFSLLRNTFSAGIVEQSIKPR